MRMPRLNLGLDDQQVITGLLRITDIFIVVGTAFTAFYLHHGFKQLPDHYYVAIALAALLTANFLHINQVYRFADLRRFSVQLGAITTGFIAIAVTLLLIAYFGKVSQNFSRVWATYWVISAFVSLLGLHAACALVIRNFYETGKLSYNIAIIGAGDPGARFYNHIMALKDSGIRVSGVFDDRVGRFDQSATACDHRLRAAGTTAREQLIAIALMQSNRLKRNSEFGVDDLRERGRVALAIILGAADQGYRAVLLESDPTHLGRRRACCLEVTGKADTA